MQDHTLSPETRELLQWTYDEIVQYEALKIERSWRNPYAEAISLLEGAARSYEGSYG